MQTTHSRTSSSSVFSTVERSKKLIPPIDYVLVYVKEDKNDDRPSGCCRSGKSAKTKNEFRILFTSAMKNAGLVVVVDDDDDDDDVVNPLVSRSNLNYTVHSDNRQTQRFVRISASFDALANEAEQLQLKLPLDKNSLKPSSDWSKEDSDFLNDSKKEVCMTRKFVRKDYHIYKGSKDEDDKDTFFRPSLRSLLVHNILINLHITDEEMKKAKIKSDDHNFCSGSKQAKRGLLYLRREDIYTDHFVLHDRSKLDGKEIKNKDERSLLYYFWCRCSTWFKFQPFPLIRDYFGEKIALYFAWCGHLITLLWIPALIGIGVFGYGLQLSTQRYASQAANRTSISANKSLSEMKRVFAGSKAALENTLAVIRESFDNDATPWFALFICLWGTIFTELWRRQSAKLAYKWDVNKYEKHECDRPDFRSKQQQQQQRSADAETGLNSRAPAPSGSHPNETEPLTPWQKWTRYAISFVVLFIMIAAACFSVAGVILFRIVATVDWFSTPEQEISRFIVASILPPVMNALSAILLQTVYNRLALVLTRWENHQKQTNYDDALILKVFGFQFVNCYSALFYIAFFQSMNYENGIFGKGERYVDACGSDDNCMSILSFQLLVMMIVKPTTKFAYDVLLPIGIRIYRQYRGKNKIQDSTPPTTTTPMDVHVAAEFQKRDLSELDDFTLFEYSEKVIQFGYVMLFAASLPLAPLIALLTDFFDIRVDAWRLLRLYRRPVGYIAEDIGMWEKIVVFLSVSGVATNAFLIAFTSQWGQKQTGNNNQFWIIIGFQNVCICLKFLLEFFISDVPSKLKTQMARKKRMAKAIKKETEPRPPETTDAFTMTDSWSKLGSKRDEIDTTETATRHERRADRRSDIRQRRESVETDREDHFRLHRLSGDSYDGVPRQRSNSRKKKTKTKKKTRKQMEEKLEGTPQMAPRRLRPHSSTHDGVKLKAVLYRVG